MLRLLSFLSFSLILFACGDSSDNLDLSTPIKKVKGYDLSGTWEFEKVVCLRNADSKVTSISFLTPHLLGKTIDIQKNDLFISIRNESDYPCEITFESEILAETTGDDEGEAHLKQSRYQTTPTNQCAILNYLTVLYGSEVTSANYNIENNTPDGEYNIDFRILYEGSIVYLALKSETVITGAESTNTCWDYHKLQVEESP